MIAGMMLTIIGAAALLAQSGVLAWHLYGMSSDPLGLLAAMGLRSMHALQALAFNPGAVSTVEHRVLVLFSALIMMLIGFVLLRRKRADLCHEPGNSAPRKGGAQ